MKREEMHWTPHGSLCFRWEHGEPYCEEFAGVVEYQGVLDLCDEYRLWEHRAKRGRTVERKARALSYEWSPDDEPEEDRARFVPDPGHTVRLGEGERIVVAHCTPEALRQWEGPAYVTAVEADEAYLYEGDGETKPVAIGPGVLRLGDVLDQAVTVMREACIG